jgi:hypothetical protein
MISIYVSNSISALFGRFLEGDEFGLVTILKSKFPVGLTHTKAKTLSRIGWVAELGRLSLCKAKTPYLGLISALSLNPDRVCWVRGLTLTYTSYKFKSSMIQIQI